MTSNCVLNSKTWRTGILVLAITLFSGTINVILAQEYPDSVVPLDSVVVTITRGTDAIGRIPFAVSVQGQLNLQLGNTGFSLEEALQGIPGVQVQNRYNYTVGERISIRGLGARAQFGVRGLKIFVDGIPATLADGQSTLDHLDIGSLGRAEIIRGPASAIYGNGGGGVISFKTAQPPDVPIQQEIKAISGGNGLLRLQSTTSGTSNKTSYLVNIANLSYDGFRIHPNNPSDFFGGADRLNINTQIRTELAGGSLSVTGNMFDLDGENPGQLNRSDLEAGLLSARNFNVKQKSGKSVHQGQLGVAWSGPLGNLSARISGWGLFRNMDNPIPPRIIDLERKAWGGRMAITSQTSDQDSKMTWTAGIDLDFQRDNRLNFENNGGTRGALTLDQLETVSATGLFVQIRTPLSERLWALGGLRYDRFHFEADDHLITDENPNESGKRTMEAISPTLGIDIRVNPNLNLYGNVATLLDTPSTTELVNRPGGGGGFNPNLEPQKGVSGEIGIRGQLQTFLGYEGSMFITRRTNELVPFEEESQPGRTFFRNSGSSKYQGLEGSIHAILPKNIYTQVTYTFVDAVFTDFVPGNSDGKVFNGNKIPGLTRHRLDGLLRMTKGSWFGEIRGDYVGGIAVNDSNSEFSSSYSLWELRTGLNELHLGRMVLSPFAGVTNLFNKIYAAAITVNAFGGRFYDPGPRRSFFTGMRVTF